MKISNNLEEIKFNKLKNKTFIKDNHQYKIIGLGESFHKEKFFILQELNNSYGWYFEEFEDMINRMKRKIIFLDRGNNIKYWICFFNKFDKYYKEVE